MFYACDIQMNTAAVATAVCDVDNTINGDSLPISSANLRKDKRERKHTAQTLPTGITQNMMKKYVVYYREFVNLKNGKRVPREYFKVESHPRLTKPWVSSKSGKISLYEKLEQANQIVTDLEKMATTDIVENSTSVANTTKTDDVCSTTERYNKYLPKYTTLRVVKVTPTLATLSLIYDQKDNSNGFRWTCSHTFTELNPPECSKLVISESRISLEIEKLKEKIYDKYAVNLLDHNI